MAKPAEPKGKLISNIPSIAERIGAKPMDLVRKGVSLAVAYRACAGELTFHVATLAKLADALGVDFAELVTYDREAQDVQA